MKWIRYIVLFIIVWFLLHLIFTVKEGLDDNYTKQNYCVIFGNKVNHDGTLSPRLRSRVDKGLELYNRGVIKTFFVSGGLGSEGYNEGSKMAEYLIQNGVKESDIEIDNLGINTKATAVNFKKAHPDIDTLVIVSQFYHIKRSRLAFKQLGFKKVESASSDYYEVRDLYSLVREFFAYYKYLLLK
ncbi:MAG: hypothetical protein CR982_09975 [Candidatus Cloacimonadota bacterium]|nr:MAG: hypothetical protein CR982_09975 [Candidatus Cloacimonadota bacterium]PIE81637.1 MAG: hypothetical protein CSA15_00505 [Candidatus Delongbacteria bacterium]